MRITPIINAFKRLKRVVLAAAYWERLPARGSQQCLPGRRSKAPLVAPGLPSFLLKFFMVRQTVVIITNHDDNQCFDCAQS